jgi:hypothetical protein
LDLDFFYSILGSYFFSTSTTEDLSFNDDVSGSSDLGFKEEFIFFIDELYDFIAFEDDDLFGSKIYFVELTFFCVFIFYYYLVCFTEDALLWGAVIGLLSIFSGIFGYALLRTSPLTSCPTRLNKTA